MAPAVADRRVGSTITPIKLMVGAGVLVVVLSVQFALYRALERFAADPLEGARLPFSRTTIEAAIAYMPFGTGIGTFVPVYAMFEKPEDTILGQYTNHAHNDFAEFWLDGGFFGLALLGMFTVWLLFCAVKLWRRTPPGEGGREIDRTLARAATIVLALLLAHSFVDYPLRTGAMMAIMAFACALLVEPPRLAEPGFEQARLAAIKKSLLPTQAPVPVVAVAAATPKAIAVLAASGSLTGGLLPTEQRWGTDLDWPEEWAETSKHSSKAVKPQNGRASPKAT